MTYIGRLAARTALVKVALITMALILLIAASPVSAQLKKNLRQAKKSWQEGDAAAAVELYEKVLDATEPGDTERPDALYALIMASLMSESPRGDSQRTQDLITEYFGFYPRHPNRLELQVVRDLLSSDKAARNEAQRRAQELVRKNRALEQELAKVQEASGENASLEAENKELTERLQAAEQRLVAKSSQLEATKQELAKQAEALQKLRQRLVGGSGDG